MCAGLHGLIGLEKACVLEYLLVLVSVKAYLMVADWHPLCMFSIVFVISLLLGY